MNQLQKESERENIERDAIERSNSSFQPRWTRETPTREGVKIIKQALCACSAREKKKWKNGIRDHRRQTILIPFCLIFPIAWWWLRPTIHGAISTGPYEQEERMTKHGSDRLTARFIGERSSTTRATNQRGRERTFIPARWLHGASSVVGFQEGIDKREGRLYTHRQKWGIRKGIFKCWIGLKEKKYLKMKHCTQSW